MVRSSSRKESAAKAAVAALTLLLALGFGSSAAAQEKQPAKNQKLAARQPEARAQVSAANGQKAVHPSDAVPEDEDYLKAREEWFLSNRILPDGSVAAGMRQRALQHLDRMIEAQRKMGLLPPEGAVPLVTAFPGPTAWSSIGPRPINVPAARFPFNGSPSNSGRVAALAVDPTSRDVAYLGAAAGGVWKTIDGGANWIPVSDDQPSLSIGAIAIDPTPASCSAAGPCQIIYVGTGEQNFSGDSYYGVGVLKSINGGTTWTQQGVGVFTGPLSASRLDGGAHIGAIAVDPLPPAGQQVVLAGAFRFSSPAASGIYRTTDGGTTWAPVAGMTGASGTAIIFDPSASGVVYAALGGPGPAAVNGVYRSTNHGATWTKMAGSTANPFPTGGVGRISLDIARSRPTTVYALIANSSGASLLGLWRTTNANLGAGADWIQQVNTPDVCTSVSGSQCDYDLIVQVSPTNDQLVFAGGSTGDRSNARALFRSTDGGATWASAANGAAAGLHVDLHALAFSKDGSRLYVGNDGGAWRSDNPGVSPIDFVNLNSTLAITMSYPGHGVHFSDENIMFVGTQDNGTQRYSGSMAWDIVTGGDGTYAAIDPHVPSTVYTDCQFICIFRSLTDGTSPLTFVEKDVGIDPADRANFVAPLIHDPNVANRIYFGTFRIWLSTDAAETWTAISPDLTTSTFRTITAIAVARSDSNVVYVGTTAGSASGSRISKTTNALAGTAANWTNVTAPTLPSGRTVTAIAVDPNNASMAYATFSGFSGFGDTLGHVFRTTDGGATWQDISGTGATALPNVPVNDILLDDVIANAAYLGTDIGVFRTTDASQGAATAWVPVPGLPKVVVLSLNTRSRSRIVRASTSGRGTWIIQDTSVPVPAGPFLASIRPSSSPADSAAVTLTNIDGANFTATSQVQWDGAQNGITTTFIDANHLTAVIPASLLRAANVGVHQITVFDPTQTPNASDFLRFTVLGAAPALSNISPSSVPVNSATTPITVTGSNFNSSSQAKFNGTATGVTTTFVNANQLTATLSNSLLGPFGSTNDITVVNAPPGGGVTIAMTFTVAAPPPGNDNFANATAVTSGMFANTVDNSGATTEPTDPVPTCAPLSANPPIKTVWYRLIAGGNGSVTADTIGSSYDTILTVWTGSPGSFANVACNDDINPGINIQSQVTFNVNSGTTYFLMVSAFGPADPNPLGLGGKTVLNVSTTVPIGADFALSSPTGAQTVNAGQSASYTITVTPQNGFNTAVTFSPSSCSFSPAAIGTSCSFNPASVTPGTTPGNSTMLTISTTAHSLLLPTPSVRQWPRRLPAPWLAAIALALAVTMLAAFQAKRRRLAAYLPLAALLVLLALHTVSCGGGGGGTPPPTGTQAGTYTVTVTGTAGTTTHNATVTLKVN